MHPEPLLVQVSEPPAIPQVILNQDQFNSLRGGRIWSYLFVLYVTIISGIAWVVVAGGSDSASSSTCVFFLVLSAYSVVISHRILGVYADKASFITRNSVYHMFLRGAIFSVLVAAALEYLDYVTAPPRPTAWGVVPLTIAIGFAEELGKFLAVLIGLHVAPCTLPQSLVWPSAETMVYGLFSTRNCTRFWTYVVESPRSLAMAGIAVGWGFATTENLEYFITIAKSRTGISGSFSMLFRILVNLHPIFTGLAAARLASSVYRDYPAVRSVSVGKIVRALVPSMLMHAMFDFGILFLMSDMGMHGTLDVCFVTLSFLSIPIAWVSLIVTYRALPSAKKHRVAPRQNVLV